MPDFPSSLIDFQHRFPDEAACAAWLFEARWPAGFRCPACAHEKGWPHGGKRFTFECAACGKQTSVTAGTILHGSSMFDRLDKRGVVVANVRLVYAPRNDPFLQGLFWRRMQQRAWALAHHPSASVTPIENDRHSVVKALHPNIRVANTHEA